MELVNRTQLVVDRAVFLDVAGAERFVFAAKATFSIGRGGALTPVEQPPPLELIDAFYGKPGASSMRAEAELGPPKPASDCILIGHVVAPSPRDTQCIVRFAVGSTSRSAVVFGRRRWTGWASRSPSDPEPFDRLPLRWEHAFGGVDDSPRDPAFDACEPQNPVGVGFIAQKSLKDLDAEELPRIEDPSNLLRAPGDRPTPVGFGFIARHWQPRVSYAGTYDAKWQRERMPLLPADFDPRFHNAAPTPLIAKRLQGGEIVRADGVSRGGPITFNLPRPEVSVTMVLAEREVRVDLAIDTVVLDADAMSISLLLKGDVGVHGELDDVLETRFEGQVRS